MIIVEVLFRGLAYVVCVVFVCVCVCVCVCLCNLRTQ
jgi:hypothetical protein